MSYDSIGGIPDLRLAGSRGLDCETDRALAIRLLNEAPALDLEQLVRRAFSLRGWPPGFIDLRVRGVMAAPQRRRTDVKGWLKDCIVPERAFLEIGCGMGGQLAAAAAEGYNGAGIDASMLELIVAQRMITASGGQPVLAAAIAEALPMADCAFSGVVALDVIEHVAEPSRMLAEINRVIEPRGAIAVSTPNRYSLSAEPHVFVWGVGWLPRRLQKAYVRWRTQFRYESTELLSVGKLRKLFADNTSFQIEIMVPPIADDEITHFSRRRAVLARMYNRFARSRGFRFILLRIGAFFRVVGKKRA
jgi:SAM-dependent methyltransferase